MANNDLILFHTDRDPQSFTTVEDEEEKVNEDEVQIEESKAGFGVCNQQ